MAKVGSSQQFDKENAPRNSIRLAPLCTDFIALCPVNPITMVFAGYLDNLLDFGPFY